jgi:hypothetical protein
VVCDWRGGRSGGGQSCAVEIVATAEIEEHSEESLCHKQLHPNSLRKPTDPERFWLAHPPRQPGQPLREEPESKEKREYLKIPLDTESYKLYYVN